VFGDINRRKVNIVDRIGEIDKVDDERGLDQ